jgi:hypothetical protein
MKMSQGFKSLQRLKNLRVCRFFHHFHVLAMLRKILKILEQRRPACGPETDRLRPKLREKVELRPRDRLGLYAPDLATCTVFGYKGWWSKIRKFVYIMTPNYYKIHQKMTPFIRSMQHLFAISIIIKSANRKKINSHFQAR